MTNSIASSARPKTPQLKVTEPTRKRSRLGYKCYICLPSWIDELCFHRKPFQNPSTNLNRKHKSNHFNQLYSDHKMDQTQSRSIYKQLVITKQNRKPIITASGNEFTTKGKLNHYYLLDSWQKPPQIRFRVVEKLFAILLFPKTVRTDEPAGYSVTLKSPKHWKNRKTEAWTIFRI